MKIKATYEGFKSFDLTITDYDETHLTFKDKKVRRKKFKRKIYVPSDATSAYIIYCGNRFYLSDFDVIRKDGEHDGSLFWRWFNDFKMGIEE